MAKYSVTYLLIRCLHVCIMKISFIAVICPLTSEICEVGGTSITLLGNFIICNTCLSGQASSGEEYTRYEILSGVEDFQITLHSARVSRR